MFSVSREATQTCGRGTSQAAARWIRALAVPVALALVLVIPTAANVCLASPGGLDGRLTAISLSTPGTSNLSESHAFWNVASMATAMPDVGEDPVTWIEEDWELKVADPYTPLAAPQVEAIMVPFSDDPKLFYVFTLNHRIHPEQEVGGMEVQLWYDETRLASHRVDADLLHHADETITWTQKLRVKTNGLGGKYLCFRIVNGQSVTWGSFGDDVLHINWDTDRTDLSQYQSAGSVDNSGVTYAAHRVTTLVLKAVRGYTATGELVYQESVPVVVFAQPEL